MKSINGLLRFFVLMSLICTFVVKNAGSEVKIHFIAVRDHLIVVPVFLNGEGPYDFLLDTGAGSTLIHTEISEKLKLLQIDSVDLISAAGSKKVPLCKLDDLKLGAKLMKNVEALITDLSEIRSLDKRIKGVLGQNVLSNFNYILDYREGLIEIEDGDEFHNDLKRGAVPVETNEGRLLITANCSKKNLRLVLDSGASTIVFFGEFSVDYESDYRFEFKGWAKASTYTGNSRAGMGGLKSLIVGSERFSNLPAAFIRNLENRCEDGLLPTRIFKSIYFNNREGYVVLNPAKRR